MRHLIFILMITLFSPVSSAVNVWDWNIVIDKQKNKKKCKTTGVKPNKNLNIIFCNWGSYVIDKVWIEYYVDGGLIETQHWNVQLLQRFHIRVVSDYHFMDGLGLMDFASNDDNDDMKVVFKYRIVGTNIKKGKIKSCTVEFDPSNTKVEWFIFGRGKTYEQNRCREKGLNVDHIEGH